MKMKSTRYNYFKALFKGDTLQMNLLGQVNLDFLTYLREIYILKKEIK
jgi:hypothetical protein